MAVGDSFFFAQGSSLLAWMTRLGLALVALCAVGAFSAPAARGGAEADAVERLRGAVDKVSTEVQAVLSSVSGNGGRSLDALGKGATGIGEVASEVQDIQGLVTDLAGDRSVSHEQRRQMVSLVSELQEVVNGLFDVISTHVDRAHGRMEAEAKPKGQHDLSSTLDALDRKVQSLVAPDGDEEDEAPAESEQGGDAASAAGAHNAASAEEGGDASSGPGAPGSESAEVASEGEEGSGVAAPDASAAADAPRVSLPSYLSPERVQHVTNVVRSAMWLHWQEVQNREKLERTRRQQQWLDHHEADLRHLEAALRRREARVATLRARVRQAEDRVFARATAAGSAPADAGETARAAPTAPAPAPRRHASPPATKAMSRTQGAGGAVESAEEKARRAEEMNQPYLRERAARQRASGGRRGPKTTRTSATYSDQEDGLEAPAAPRVVRREKSRGTSSAPAATGAHGSAHGGSGFYVASQGLSSLPAAQLRMERRSAEERRRHLVLHAAQENPDGTVAPQVVTDVDTHLSDHRRRASRRPAVTTDPRDVTRPVPKPSVRVERVKTKAEREAEAAPWANVEPEEVTAEELAIHHLKQHKGVVVAKIRDSGEETVLPGQPSLNSPAPAFREVAARLRGRKGAALRSTLQPQVWLQEDEAAMAAPTPQSQGAAGSDNDKPPAGASPRSDPSEPLVEPYRMPNPRDFDAAEESEMRPWMNDADDQPPLPELPA